jgi:hypothetical protein
VPGSPVLRRHPDQKLDDQTLQSVQRKGIKVDGGRARHTRSQSRPSCRGKPPESNRRTRCPGFLTAYSHALPDDRPARERGEPKKPGDAPVSILTVVERGGDLRMGVLQAQNAGAIRYELGDCLERGTIITMDAAKNFGKTFRKMGRAVQFSL